MKVLNNQYLPNGFGRPAATYFYIVNDEGKVYHKDGKFRKKTLIQLNTYAFHDEKEALETASQLGQQ